MKDTFGREIRIQNGPKLRFSVIKKKKRLHKKQCISTNYRQKDDF